MDFFLLLNEGCYIDNERSEHFAEFLLKHLTRRAGKNANVDGILFWDHNGINYSCFPKVATDEECYEATRTGNNVYNQRGLNLKIDDVEVLQEVATPLCIWQDEHLCIARANITTKKTSDDFKGIEWIPEAGKTRSVVFCVNYVLQNNWGALNDLDVIEWE